LSEDPSWDLYGDTKTIKSYMKDIDLGGGPIVKELKTLKISQINTPLSSMIQNS
jgi:hypothetical protein